MRCQQCGDEFSEKYRFCPTCGSAVSGVSGEEADVSLDGLKTQNRHEASEEFDTLVGDQSIGVFQTEVQVGGDEGALPEALILDTLSSRYEMVDEIGRGGFARVWKARDRKLDRLVAVKRLVEPAVKDAAFKMTVERFRREATAIASLNHRNIVGVYDVGADDEGDYIVMELVEGGSLRDWLKQRGKMVPEEAVRLIQGVARGLGYAHKKNLIHRDIKPENILLQREGEEWVPKIVDFGLARVGRESELSVTGYGMGTLWYMPPEQRRDAKRVNHTADIYALGKTLYELLTGDEPDQVDSEKVPPTMAKLILHCVKINPDERFFSADELIAALEGTIRIPVAAAPPSVWRDLKTETPCSNCGAVNPNGAQYCEHCGAGMLRKCPECSKSIQISSPFCQVCGTDISAFRAIQDHLKKIDEYYADVHLSRAEKEYALASERNFAAHGRQGEQLLEALETRRQVLVEAIDLQRSKAVEWNNYRDLVVKLIGKSDFQHAGESLDKLRSFSPHPVLPTFALWDAGTKGWMRQIFGAQKTLIQPKQNSAVQEKVEKELIQLEASFSEKWAVEMEVRIEDLVRRGQYEDIKMLVASVEGLPLSHVKRVDLRQRLNRLFRDRAIPKLQRKLSRIVGSNDFERILCESERILEFDPNNAEVKAHRDHASRMCWVKDELEKAQEYMQQQRYADAMDVYEHMWQEMEGDFNLQLGEERFTCSGLLETARRMLAHMQGVAEELRSELELKNWKRVQLLQTELTQTQAHHPFLSDVNRALRSRRRKWICSFTAGGFLVVAGIWVSLFSGSPTSTHSLEGETRGTNSDRSSIQDFDQALLNRRWVEAAEFAQLLATEDPIASEWLRAYRSTLDVRGGYITAREDISSDVWAEIGEQGLERLRAGEQMAEDAESFGDWPVAQTQWLHNQEQLREMNAEAQTRLIQRYRQAEIALNLTPATYVTNQQGLSEEDRQLLEKQTRHSLGDIKRALGLLEKMESGRTTSLIDKFPSLYLQLSGLQGDTSKWSLSVSIESDLALTRTDLLKLWNQTHSGLKSLHDQVSRLEILQPIEPELKKLHAHLNPQLPGHLQAGLMAVLTLGYSTMNFEAAMLMAEHFQSSHPLSPYNDLMQMEAYTDSCRSCGGDGNVTKRAHCRVCNSTGVCVICKGSRTVPGIDSYYGRVRKTCGTCQGTGRCRQCPPTMTRSNCTKCKGKGKIVNEGLLNEGYKNGLQMLKEDVQKLADEMTQIELGAR